MSETVFDIPSKTTLDDPGHMLYLGLSFGDNFGWGICGQYLRKELSRRVPTILLENHPELAVRLDLPGKVFQTVSDHEFHTLYPARGLQNLGYAFFEYELTRTAIERAKQFDLIFCGSSWCRDKLLQQGISQVEVLIQGIDPDLFYPMPPRVPAEGFVIFSGGKLELRKGQDLVLKAVALLQQKYKDLVLVTAWFNLWPQTMASMEASPFIRFELKGDSWRQQMEHLCQVNGLDPARVVNCENIPHHQLREVFAATDLGLFPNRCEGGTNLMLMEYMACGRPVIASHTSGHRDILNGSNSLSLTELQPFTLRGPNGVPLAAWEYPSLDELVSKIEYAYHHRERLGQLGRKAGEDLKSFTWAATADRFMERVFQ
jgi:glycosyltransferase involved in cell wall biosynthesis